MNGDYTWLTIVNASAMSAVLAKCEWTYYDYGPMPQPPTGGE